MAQATRHEHYGPNLPGHSFAGPMCSPTYQGFRDLCDESPGLVGLRRVTPESCSTAGQPSVVFPITSLTVRTDVNQVSGKRVTREFAKPSPKVCSEHLWELM